MPLSKPKLELCAGKVNLPIWGLGPWLRNMLVAKLMGMGSKEKLGPTKTFCASHWGLLRGAVEFTEIFCAHAGKTIPAPSKANVQAISRLVIIFQI
jgi:hypothetical protein